MSLKNSTLKTFGVHPSIIKSIILEQAGDPVKALAELVMNSIDAGATAIHLTVDSKGFEISDDGVGFPNKEHIVNFFGAFGTPHKQGDAEYGKFRLGRGQIMALSTTEWRSGFFGMDVDLENLKDAVDIGYSISQFDNEHVGCTIKGKFYTPLHDQESVISEDLFNKTLSDCLNLVSTSTSQKDLMRILCDYSAKQFQSTFFVRLFRMLFLVNTPIFVNGVKITSVIPFTKLFEDKYAEYYEFPKSAKLTNLLLLNKGIFISKHSAPFPMIINFKVQPQLNMARNMVNSECECLKSALKTVFQYGWQQVLGNNKYYFGLLENFLNGLCHNKESVVINRTLQMANYRGSLDLETFDKILGLIKVKLIGGKQSSISLLDCIDDIRANGIEGYRDSSDYIVKSMGGINLLKAHLSTLGDPYRVITGVFTDSNTRWFTIRLLQNIETFYERFDPSYESFADDMVIERLVDFKLEKPKRTLKKTDDQLTFGEYYREVSPAKYIKNEALHSALKKAIEKLRNFAIAYITPDIHPPLAKSLIFAENPFTIHFFDTATKDKYISCGSMGRYKFGTYYYFEDTQKHAIFIDLNDLITRLKYQPKSIVMYLYLILLDAEPSQYSDMAHHRIRVKNEECLFEKGAIFNNILECISAELVKSIDLNTSPKPISISNFEKVQAQITLIQNALGSSNMKTQIDQSILNDLDQLKSLQSK